MPKSMIQRLLVGLALLLPILGLSIGWSQLERPGEAEASEAQIVTPPSAMVVEAALGEDVADLTAAGDDAFLINASLPFEGGPNPAARAFNAGPDAFARAHLCLTQAIYYEAGFEPVEGRRAVAQVVLNRVKHPAFPASVCGVVYEGAKKPVCQFSFTCDGSLDRRPAAAAWASAKAIAAEALQGRVEPSVGMATHYHADYVAPRWAPMLAKIHKVGAHIFYRWPGQWGRPGAFTERYVGEPVAIAALQRTAPPVDTIEELDAPVEIAEAEPFPTRAVDPTIHRAENDVGGLIDVSKEWRPTLPDPTRGPSAAARVAATQQGAVEVAAKTPSTPQGAL
ncbi:cell wall hydrolase [Sphingomicrobium sp. XHP0235]|uniref:cell wall hydrolase n=1 Tax=Sphingomicrobium aquimarinum TaxID=3133971 RepID=UPI0031FEA338